MMIVTLQASGGDACDGGWYKLLYCVLAMVMVGMMTGADGSMGLKEFGGV